MSSKIIDFKQLWVKPNIYEALIIKKESVTHWQSQKLEQARLQIQQVFRATRFEEIRSIGQFSTSPQIPSRSSIALFQSKPIQM